MGQDLEVWSARDPLRFRMRQPSKEGVPYDAAYANCVTSVENPKTGKVSTEKLSPSVCKDYENSDPSA